MTNIENLRTALESRANDYTRKPFDPLEIEARIKSNKDSQEYFTDIDHNSQFDTILHKNINKLGHVLDFKRGNNLPIIHIFDKDEIFISKYLKTYDINSDNIENFLFITGMCQQ